MSEQQRPYAGKVFQKALGSDPKAQAALRRSQARLRAFGEVVHVAFAAIPGSLWADLTTAALVPLRLGADIVGKVLQAQQLVIDEFAKRVWAQWQEVQDDSKGAQAEEWRRLSAELDAIEQQYEADWKKDTGVVPPQWATIDDLETIAIPWWQEQAAMSGIDPNKILDAGEKVFPFERIIRGRLKLLRLQAAATATRRRRCPPLEKKTPKMTKRQSEVLLLWPECRGNFAEIGRRLRLDPKTVKQHYDAAMKKLRDAGLPTPDQKLKPTTGRLPESGRGEVDLYEDHDGQIQQGRSIQRRRSSGKRLDEQ